MPSPNQLWPIAAERCRHCRLRKQCPKNKSLCHRCRTTPEINRLYISTNKYGKRGIGGENVVVKLPEPTATLPGTEERLRVLEGRAKRGEAMHHPEDA